MSWTAPRDWTDGEVPDKAMMDAQVKGNQRLLKGLDGVVTLDSGPDWTQSSVQFSTSPLLWGVYDSAASPDFEAGMRLTRVDATTGKLEIMDASAWREVYHTGNWGNGHIHTIVTAASSGNLDPLTSAYQDIPGLSISATKTGHWLLLATVYFEYAAADNTYIQIAWAHDQSYNRTLIGEATGSHGTYRATAFCADVHEVSGSATLKLQAQLSSPASSPASSKIIGGAGQCKVYGIFMGNFSAQ